MFQHDLFVRDLYFRILCVCNKNTCMIAIIMFFYCVCQGLWPSGCEEPVPANSNAHPIMHARALILCWCLDFFELSNIQRSNKNYRFDILHLWHIQYTLWLIPIIFLDLSCLRTLLRLNSRNATANFLLQSNQSNNLEITRTFQKKSLMVEATLLSKQSFILGTQKCTSINQEPRKM